MTEENNQQNEQQKQREKIKENPANFDAWTALVTSIEKEGDSEKIKKIYEEFLSEFPLLYLYWKKYAELENKTTGEENAKKIYERGVIAVSKSVDLWTHYCSFVAEKSPNLDEIRNLFERAAESIGQDFQSKNFWDVYIQFEISQDEFGKVTSLFHRVLRIPSKELDKYWERYKSHAASRPIQELATQEEFNELQKESSEQKMRQTLLEWREQLYQKTAEEVKKIATFEAGITRPYFHIQTMDEAQLNNWRLYLSYQEKEGNLAKTVHLYEKCLVPCCLYFEFWIRYVKFLESVARIQEARHVLERAANVYLKRRPETHLALSEFEEQQGNIEKARRIFNNLINQIAVGHIESILRLIYFEKRQNNLTEAEHIFETQKQSCSKDDKVLAYYIMEQAKFIAKSLGKPERAIQIYEKYLVSSNEQNGSAASSADHSDVVSKLKKNKNLWLAYLNFSFNHGNSNQVDKSLENAITTDSISTTDKIEVLQFGAEIAITLPSITKYRKIQQIILQLQTEAVQTAANNKRTSAAAATTSTENESSERSSKNARTGPAPSSPTLAAANPNAAASWYGQYPAAATAAQGATPAAAATNAAAYQYPPNYQQYYQQYQQYYQQPQQQ